MVLSQGVASGPGRWSGFGVCWRGGSGGGWGEGDFAAGEVFELADEVAFAASFVDPGFVEVGSEVLVVLVGVVE
jgi:hypothetical protein